MSRRRHVIRVNVAHGTGTGAQGAGLDLSALNPTWISCVDRKAHPTSEAQDRKHRRSLLLSVRALHIDDLAAKGAEHLLDHWILFSRLAQALFLELLLAPLRLFL